VPPHRLERAQRVQRQPAAVDEAIRRDLGFSVRVRGILRRALIYVNPRSRVNGLAPR
jgi:hypothetical protein